MTGFKLPKISVADDIVNRGGTFGGKFVPDPRPPGISRILDDLDFLGANKPVTRPAPATRNMTSAQKGAIDARKGKKKKDKKKDNSWPVEGYGSMVSDGYKKAGPKGGMR
jgi:hypothetical protein